MCVPATEGETIGHKGMGLYILCTYVCASNWRTDHWPQRALSLGTSSCIHQAVYIFPSETWVFFVYM